MGRKKKNKQKVLSDSTAFTKAEWFGVGKRQRKRKGKSKQRTKVMVKVEQASERLPDEIIEILDKINPAENK